MTVNLEYLPQNEQPRPRSAGRRVLGVTIAPGSTALSDEQWKEIENDPTIEALLDQGALKVSHTKTKETAPEKGAIEAGMRTPATAKTAKGE
jgi:hypothetical protein